MKKRQIIAFKIKEFINKIRGQKLIVSIIFILLLIGLIIGISYALLEYQTNKSVDNLLTTKVGDLSITFSSNSNTISMENAQPMSDVNGLLQTPYTFTVTNNGASAVGFIIKLNEFYYDTSTHVDTTLHFPANKLKVNVNNGSTSVTNYLTSSYTVIDDTLSASQSRTYSVRVWIDVTAGSEVSGKHYHGRIEITDSYVPVIPTTNILTAVQTNLSANLYTPVGDNDQTFIVGTVSDINYNPNNYLWYSGKLWRVVALNKTAGTVTSIKLITQDSLASFAWDGPLVDGGNAEASFQNSFIYQWLHEDFYDTLRNPTNFLVTDYGWNSTTTWDDTKPPNTMIETAPIGLLNRYEYYNSYTNTTAANGYLNIGYYWFLLNDSSKGVTSVGGLLSPGLNLSYGVRPSINIKTNIMLGSGDGTVNNPYRLVGDNDQESDLINDNLNTRYSGEYVRFNNENFRIVTIEDGLTKLVQVDYLRDSGTPLSKAFGTTKLYSQSLLDGATYWGGYLNTTWYQNLSAKNKSMLVSRDWYFAEVEHGQSYKKGICATVQTIANGGTLTSNCIRTSSAASAKVGLLRHGEIFSGQLGSGITTSYVFRLITPRPTYVFNMTLEADNRGNSSSPSTTTPARPSIYLRSSTFITGGTGTPSAPFIIDIPSSQGGQATILEKVNSDLESNLYTPAGDTDQTFIIGTLYDNNFKPNNYVWYSGKLWRIVALNKTSGTVTSIKMTTNEPITAMYRDGLAANGGGSGNGDFLNSFMYQWLNEDFYDTLRNPTNYLITDYSWNATLMTNNVKPPNTTMVTCKVGALNTYEYFNSYKNTTAANGYLNMGYQWWLVNPYYAAANCGVVNYNGGYTYSTATTAIHAIRPAVNLKPDIMVVGGTGTETDPYRLEGDNDTPAANTLINTRYSGEYVTFNSEPYRIVKVEGSLTKLVKNDYIRSSGTPVTKIFSSNNSYATSLTLANTYWGKYLNGTTTSEWYGTLGATNQNMIATSTWYLGTVGTSYSYKLGLCATVQTIANGGTLTSNCTKTATTASAKVGLIRFGEMFSSQLASSYSTAVNFWTLTPQFTGYVYYLNTYSTAVRIAPTNTYATRPVIYLNSSVYITGGNGTSTNPFTISM